MTDIHALPLASDETVKIHEDLKAKTGVAIGLYREISKFFSGEESGLAASAFSENLLEILQTKVITHENAPEFMKGHISKNAPGETLPALWQDAAGPVTRLNRALGAGDAVPEKHILDSPEKAAEVLNVLTMEKTEKPSMAYKLEVLEHVSDKIIALSEGKLPQVEEALGEFLAESRKIYDIGQNYAAKLNLKPPGGKA
ncbi:MAG: hypothetical protein JWM96_858 [Alphaproteobacteria bacterium]|nr:hypothetical protein [Alphaproteobacteria bacterium]